MNEKDQAVLDKLEFSAWREPIYRTQEFIHLHGMPALALGTIAVAAGFVAERHLRLFSNGAEGFLELADGIGTGLSNLMHSIKGGPRYG